MATHSSVLAWRIPGTGEPGELPYVGCAESDTTEMTSVQFSCSVMSHSLRPMRYSPPGFSATESSEQEYWSGLPFPSPGDLPDPGIEPGSPSLQAEALPSEPPNIGFLLIFKIVFIFRFLITF